MPKPNVSPTVVENISSTPSVTEGLLKKAPIPMGSQTYQIMQASNAVPKIVQATVDPVNVRVGDTQILTVIISDPDPITSVVATIQTDNGTTTVPLMLVGAAALNDVVPQKYFVNAENELVLTNPSKENGDGNVALAAEGDQKYSASWTVKDTHTARYSTVFTATDAEGNVNSAKIGWTDALCSWNGTNNNNGGTVSISSVFGSGGCSFANNETDGVENGNLLIDAPVTLAQGSSLIINPGKSLKFSGSGQLSLPATTPLGQIEFSDMYCSSPYWTTTFITGTDAVVRSNLSNNVFPGQTAVFYSPTLTDLGQNTYDYSCAGTVKPVPYTPWAIFSSQNSGGGVYYETYMNTSVSTNDIRLCVTSQSQTQCTPWASAGGGWSDWTPVGDSFDSFNGSISVQSQALPTGYVIANIYHGVQVDENNNMSDLGNSCTAYMETAPAGTWTNPSYGTTYCNGTSLSTTPDQGRVYLSGTESLLSNVANTVCSQLGCY
jgi:hypothetical protein